MTFPAIRIEGQIFSGEMLQRLDQPDMAGQRPTDFGLPPDSKAKDEIARAWAAGQSYYRAFRAKIGSSSSSSSSSTSSAISHPPSAILPQPSSLVSETRNLWLVPFLALLGYNPGYARKGEELNGKTYPISHRDDARDGLPIHLLGWNDSLDKRRDDGSGPRMSPHALVQEYLNLTEHLYGIVANGRTLRLLRDSTRLVRQSFIEFDLERMFDEDLFADFAVLFRLLHVTRLPAKQATASASFVEQYHQDALDQGSRIRDGLSKAVERAILSFGNGFLTHPDNDALRAEIAASRLKPDAYYNHLLRLIYRFLFLLVIEERHLIFPPTVPARKRDIYYGHYSLQRIRHLAEKPHLAERRQQDLWLAIRATFRLFEADGPGQKLDVAPLAGDLFGSAAIGPLNQCALDNGTVLDCIRALSLYQNPDTHQLIRVNYAALNVEEFGSVYEGLLEYEPVFAGGTNPPGEPLMSDNLSFAFKPGDERAATGSHYTPDELVQPLIRHSLDYLIADKLKEKDKAKALLSLRVADISCGSGHILLAAARRIATELAIVRTGEEQPSPTAFRAAVRDVIRECIYGVDLNPLAVELCKVALWLEAHNPGQPLNFLDHHIKCGNAIVGYARREEVERGVPDEAFKALPGDDKDIASALRKRNKAERKEYAEQQVRQVRLDYAPAAEKQLSVVLQHWREIAGLPEKTPDEIAAKKDRYEQFISTADAFLLKQVLAIPIAQFYLPKTDPNKLITDADFRLYWTGQRHPQDEATAAAFTTAFQKRFFHWFLEFPEIFQSLEKATAQSSKDWKKDLKIDSQQNTGGFDCILGNPPYLGTKHLSGTYGYAFCEFVQWEYAPAGISDLVAYFVRRIYNLLRPGGFTAFITTNSIKDGDIRRDSLDQILAHYGVINMAVRAIRWPGRAKVVVSLVALYKGAWKGQRVLDGQAVPFISSYFEDSADDGDPKPLEVNTAKIFQGSIFLGDGFLLTIEEATRLRKVDKKNADVIFKILNGQELNNQPNQESDRSIINFFDWPIEKAKEYIEPFGIVEEKVKPFRATQNRQRNRDVWWIYAEHRPGLNRNIRPLSRCFVTSRVTKYLNFSSAPTNRVFLNTISVFTTDRWDIYAAVQSTIHEVWARKYSMSLKQDLQYSPSDCFETYPFPAGQWQTPNPALAEIGECYHEHRRALMYGLWLGLTDIYNLFHDPDLESSLKALFDKRAAHPEWRHAIPADKQSEAGHLTYAAALAGLLDLRRLHVELDQAVLSAYGWGLESSSTINPDPSSMPIVLGHTFVEVETLPENDRTRYTITPAARKELLKRLLEENHLRVAAQGGKRAAAMRNRVDTATSEQTGDSQPELAL